MAKPRPTLETTKYQAFRRLRRPLALTRAGMVAERMIRAFWPFGSVVMVALAASLLNAHETDVSRAALLGAAGGVALLGLCTLIWGLWRLRLPARAEALDRLDRPRQSAG